MVATTTTNHSCKMQQLCNNHDTTVGNDDATMGNDDQPQQPSTTATAIHNGCNNHDATMMQPQEMTMQMQGDDDANIGNDATTATTNHNHKTQPQHSCQK